jgi:hypothetical protein
MNDSRSFVITSTTGTATLEELAKKNRRYKYRFFYFSTSAFFFEAGCLRVTKRSRRVSKLTIVVPFETRLAQFLTYRQQAPWEKA